MESTGDRDKRGTAARELDADDPLLELFRVFRQLPNWRPREEIYGEVIRQELEHLSSSGARKDFELLCAAGCHRAVLTAIVCLIRYRSNLEAFWSVVIGSPEQREDRCEALDNAAVAIEREFASVLDNDSFTTSLTDMGRIPPARLASELRLYSRLLQISRRLADDMGVRSLEHFSTLIFASYVERATGTNHHGPIAGIIAEAYSRPDYTEDAQKQWRYRNKELLDNPSSAISRLSDFLLDLTAALNHVR